MVPSLGYASVYAGEETCSTLFRMGGLVSIVGHVCALPLAAQQLRRSDCDLQRWLKETMVVSAGGAAKPHRAHPQGALSQVHRSASARRKRCAMDRCRPPYCAPEHDSVESGKDGHFGSEVVAHRAQRRRIL